MKKTLSRLLCAFLVAAMVCAMVPAVAAATPGDSESNPIVLYTGDTASTTLGCTTSGHSRTAKYELLDNGSVVNSSASNYVSWNSSTGVVRANSATFYTNKFSKFTEATLKVTVTCNKADCSHKTETAYYKVYSKASSISLKNGTSTLGNNDALTVIAGTDVVLDYTVLSSGSSSSTTANQTAVSAVGDPSGIVTATANSNKTITIKTSADNAGARGYFTITMDKGTTHEVTRKVDVVLASSAVVTIKNGNTVIAKTGDTDKTLSATVGDKFSLTATVDTEFGGSTNVVWTTEKVDNKGGATVASFNTKNQLEVYAAGEARIKATLYNKSNQVISVASFTLKAVDKITSVSIKDLTADPNGKTNAADQELTTSGLKLKAVVTPDNAAGGNAELVTWTTSNKDIAYFDVKDAKDANNSTSTSGATVTVKPVVGSNGTATISATVGGKTDFFTVTVKGTKDSRVITKIYQNSEYVIRGSKYDSADAIVSRFNAKYTTIPAEYTKDSGTDATTVMVNVPVKWVYASISGNTATVSGIALESDETAAYDYSKLANKNQVQVTTTLTDEAVVSALTVSADKTTAVAGNVIRLTAKATVEPAGATASYQWYVNGKAISGATAATASYTIPEASVDSATEYKFTCVVTATKDKKSSSTESQPFTVTVSRDYTVSVTVNDAKATYTVGEKPKATATLYYKNNAVSGTSFTWTLLDNTKGNTLSNDLATISGSGNSATITTKGAAAAAGDKVLVQASVSYNGYTFSGTATITVNPASAKDVKMSVGTGSTIKGSAITSAVNTAINNTDLSVSYIVFGTPNGGSLYTSSTAKTALGMAACYVSATGSQQKLNNVYFVPSAAATAPSVTYSAYNAKGGVIATGKVTFDTTEVSGTNIYSKGTDFKTAGLVESLASANVSTSTYVVFGNVKGGALYYDYKSFTSKTAVGSTDKFYFSGSDKQLADVYFVPAADTYTATIEYSIFNGSGSAAATDTITFTTVKQNSSRSFNDVTNANVGSWASNAVDFMSANALVGGTGTGKFSPMDKMTRAMLVTVLYRAAGSPSVTGLANPFTDVAKNQYYYNAVLWAYSKGVVTGNSATTFNPNGNISRQDIAAILYRYAGSPAATGSVTSFTDNANISSYALTAMKWAVGSGYIGGSGNKLNPTGQATRAEVAVMLHRFLTK